MGFIPLTEGSGIDLHDGGFGEGVGSDEFVVGWMESHHDHANLTRDPLGSPREVAGVETQGSILAVPSTRANDVDTLLSDSGVGRLTTELERSLLTTYKSEEFGAQKSMA